MNSPNTSHKYEIVVDDEFKNLIPPLAEAELEHLHTSLERRGGARDPIVVWRKHKQPADEPSIVLDGHNRLAWCLEKNLAFDVVVEMSLNRDHAKDWMLKNQLGRRNLTPEAASILRGKLYNARKKEQGGDRKSKGQTDPLIDTAQAVAKETGVSPKTVKRDAKFADAVESLDIEADVMSGKEKRSKRDIVEAAKDAGTLFSKLPPMLQEKVESGEIDCKTAAIKAGIVRVDPWLDDEIERKAKVEAGQSVVANQQRDKNLILWARDKGLMVYIGRGTDFGNPFVLEKDGDRGRVCDLYERFYLPHKDSILSRLDTLQGKVLVCHCYPKRCHGNSLIES